jgi:hypothetical protein
VLFNEPKLLKSASRRCSRRNCFRAEIAEIVSAERSFSALQRAEIAEILSLQNTPAVSVLERNCAPSETVARHRVSVLFNEPKLLK